MALTGENNTASPGSTDHADVRIPPPAIYLAGFGVGLLLEAAAPIEGLSNPAKAIAGIAGILLWAFFDGRATVEFIRRKTSMIPIKPASTLVTNGPYSRSRNPMYIGMAALYAGLAVWLDVIWAVIVLPLVLLAVDRYVIAREERYLERRFGDEYLRYKARVHRWI
jgi:protein-S-isoprenylcysteine O-methyltransferase Ste14